MKTTKYLGIALGVFALVAMAQPAQATCGAPFLISSINSNSGYYAYVINPTVTPGPGGDGLSGSTVTGQLVGFFWGVGVGDPAIGVGADNGTWTGLDWMYIYTNYPASVLTTWAASTGIDTCIDVMGGLGARCQATLIQDVDVMTGAGMFALVSTPDNAASGDFFLDNGGVNLTLAAMPGPTIASSASTPAGCRDGGTCTGVDLMMQLPTADDLTAGAFLDASPECIGAGPGGVDPLNGLVLGANLYYTVVARGGSPADFVRTNWTNAGAGLGLLGSTQAVSVDCSGGDSDVFVAWSMMMDSGFESDLLSSSATRVECGPNIAEPGQIREAPRGRQAPRSRQR